jgi:hypothetical protein
MKKATIQELEQILDGNSLPVKIMPNGEVKMDFLNCIWKDECTNPVKIISSLKNDIMDTNIEYISNILNENAMDDDLAKDAWKDISAHKTKKN